MTRLAVLLAIAGAATAQTGAPLTLQISSETAPPGGYAQFAKSAPTTPAQIPSGGLIVQFDPTIFQSITSASVLSADGDALGEVFVSKLTVTVQFYSTTASLGQLPGIPMILVTAQVLPTAAPGAMGTVTAATVSLDSPASNFTATVNPGTITVGGTVSVSGVTPGMGLLPSGATVVIDGTGFTSATSVTIDGVVVASTQLVSATEIDATLGGQTELAGKHLHVGGGDYVIAVNAIGGTVLPQLPPPQQGLVEWTYDFSNPEVVDFSCLQNPSGQPVTADYYFVSPPSILTHKAVVIPPYGISVIGTGSLVSTVGDIYMVSTAPLRMADIRNVLGGIPSISPPTSPDQPNLLNFGLSFAATLQYQIGQAAPQPQTFSFPSGFPYTISTSASWLSFSPAQGTAPSTIAMTIDPTKLGQGTYQATVTFTETLPADLAPDLVATTTSTVTVNVNSQPAISGGGSASFYVPSSGTPTLTAAVPVSSNGTSAPIIAAVVPGTGGNWLSFTGPTSTPATLMLNRESGPPLDPAQQQVFNRIEGDRAHSQCIVDGLLYFCQLECLQQSQRLHELAFAFFPQARFHQAAEFVKAFRHLPANQRRRLVERVGLLLQQRQVVQRVEDHVFAFIAPRMARDHFAFRADHHFMHEPFHQHFAVSPLHRHRVVVGAIAHQRHRSDPRGSLVAGFVPGRGQGQQPLPIFLETLCDRLLVSPQLALPPLLRLNQQVSVERFPGGESRTRYHEVPPSVAHQPFHFPLVPGRPNFSANR